MAVAETPQSICRFGIARCDVTPPVGAYHRVWGAARHDRSTGIHRPLTATAMVFQAGDAKAPGDAEQVLVAVDHCLFWAREMEALLGRIVGETGVPRDRIVVSFSHTHAAGLFGLERVHLPGGELIPGYLEELGASLAGIVAAARRSAEPATITYGRGRCPLAAHRDLWDPESGQYVCGFDPAGPADDTVLVARVTNVAGRLLATVVNYACHPTTLAWQNTLVSPDYPGAMRETVEEASGAPCVFLQGAAGDLGPREGFVGDVAVADRNGRQLGHAALAVLESLPPPRTYFEYTGPLVSGATIGTWAHRPLTPPQLEQKACWRGARWTIDLAHRPDLPTADQVRAERTRWEAEEAAAQQRGDAADAARCRALVERQTRLSNRLADLPAGRSFAYPIVLWQMGDAWWVAVEGEPYQLLQTALRNRWPDRPIVVAELANGSRCAYLPPAEIFGKGIYQESIAVLAPGSLEAIITAIAGRMADWEPDASAIEET